MGFLGICKVGVTRSCQSSVFVLIGTGNDAWHFSVWQVWVGTGNSMVRFGRSNAAVSIAELSQ